MYGEADDDGADIENRGTETLKNTIAANNTLAIPGDCSGTITSNADNLDSDGSCGLGGGGDISNTNPQLGPLADNGGPTQTRALPPADRPSTSPTEAPSRLN